MTEQRGRPRDPRRRGKAWTTVGHGIRIPSGLTGRAALLAELTAWQAVLPPSAAWTGLTGAEVHGLWLPTLPTLPPQTPLFAAAGRVAGEVIPVRSRLAVSRHPAPPNSVTVDGVGVEPVADCILAAARFLPVLDLVVLIDSALQLGRCTHDEIARACARRRHGAPATRVALALSDGRSESAWETLLRLLHVVCGIVVEPQAELRDSYGAFVARADLRVTGTDLLQEYDGAQHRDAAEQRKDLRRARRIADVGAVRRGYVARDLLEHGHLILRAADEALGHTAATDPGPWLEMVAASLYTPAGRRAFLERVRANWAHVRPPEDQQ